jgi:ABC-2 type transport system ATP-binding protein
VTDAAVFGNALHVVVPEAAQAIPRLRGALSERGVRVTHMAPIRPSLEDVFVSLTAAQAVGKA